MFEYLGNEITYLLKKSLRLRKFIQLRSTLDYITRVDVLFMILIGW